MRVLLTGASSFTGYWFAKALTLAGHEVIAPLRQASDEYRDGPRVERVRKLAGFAQVVEAAPFGSGRFVSLTAERFDVLCHHAAHVGDYRSPDFNVAHAIAENTSNLRKILMSMKERGLKAVIHTGSVFEPQEGIGEPPLRAFSPYGISKAFTAQLVAFYANDLGIPAYKFVIPNPFGPLEEPRFCAYLIRCWRNGTVAKVNTPAYVRDNIHVDLLALAYEKFLSDVMRGVAPEKFNPSGYVETQGCFAERFARAMRARLNLACGIELATQTEFPEPVTRINYQSAAQYVPEWNEVAAWDSVAESHLK